MNLNNGGELEIDKDFANLINVEKLNMDFGFGMQALSVQTSFALTSTTDCHNDSWPACTATNHLKHLTDTKQFTNKDDPVHFDLSAYEDLIESSDDNDDDDDDGYNDDSGVSFNTMEFNLNGTYNAKTMSRKQMKSMLNAIAECVLENPLENSNCNDIDHTKEDYNTSSDY